MSENCECRFDEEVSDALGYYVYRLVDPRTSETFYVGKGKGNRVCQHLKGVIDGNSDVSEDARDELSEKLGRIREIQNAGYTVGVIIHRHGMSEAEALHVEAALIDAYPGLTNIVGGHGSRSYGVMHLCEVIDLYKAQVADVTMSGDKLVMININRSSSALSTYDAVRYAWRLNPKRANQASFILAVDRGRIVGVFKADAPGWIQATAHNFPGFPAAPKGRYGFHGTEVKNSPYLGKRLPKSHQHVRYPIRYNYP